MPFFCAKAIQDACLEQPELSLRIGIHLGDVIFEGDDVFGDGVNIASRLEALASPGEILVSDSVYWNVHNKEQIKTRFLGEEYLKNVIHPVKVYRIEADSSPGQDPSIDTSGKSKRTLTYGLLLIVALALGAGYLFYPGPTEN